MRAKLPSAARVCQSRIRRVPTGIGAYSYNREISASHAFVEDQPCGRTRSSPDELTARTAVADGLKRSGQGDANTGCDPW